MECKVSLEQFEGPLDLMLHLISKNRLDLMDLDLDCLAGQYVSYIRSVQKEHLEIASEYMVEFCSLLEYKSRKLLPKKQEAAMPDDTYEEDQRNKLVARLLEYQEYKEASAFLAQYMERRTRKMARQTSSLVDTWSVPKESAGLANMQVHDLWKAMKRVMNRHALLNPYQTAVEVKELSVEECMERLQSRLHVMESCSRLEAWMQECTSLHEMVVTFLALLEMIHSGLMTVWTDDKENIWIQIPPSSAS